MSWAATESIALFFTPRRRLSASTELKRSSTRATGSRKRPSSWRAKRSTRFASGCSPFAATGRPMTNCPGCHSCTSRLMASNPGAAIGGSGCAVRSSGSPTATPMRLRPKSKARTVRAMRSGMSRFVLEPRVVEAEQLHRLSEPLVRRNVEEDRVLRFDGEPGVLRELLLELAGRPAGIAERHQYALRAFAAADRFENVLRGGEADRLAHAQRRLPVARRLVQHEAAIGLHRTAEIDRRFRHRAIGDRKRQALEEGLQRHVDRTVHHQAKRALVVMLADVSQRPGKVRIRHV